MVARRSLTLDDDCNWSHDSQIQGYDIPRSVVVEDIANGVAHRDYASNASCDKRICWLSVKYEGIPYNGLLQQRGDDQDLDGVGLCPAWR